MSEANGQALQTYLEGQPPAVVDEVQSIRTTSQRKVVGLDIVLLSILAASGFLGTLGLPKRKIEEAAPPDSIA